jgi:hypothetical protein
MRFRLPKFKHVPGQLLLFQRVTARQKRKVSLRDFDPKRHTIADLDQRTIPRKQYTKQVVDNLAAAIG